MRTTKLYQRAKQSFCNYLSSLDEQYSVEDSLDPWVYEPDQKHLKEICSTGRESNFYVHGTFRRLKSIRFLVPELQLRDPTLRHYSKCMTRTQPLPLALNAQCVSTRGSYYLMITTFSMDFCMKKERCDK
jgi:hypothetical protein